jgi:hypothetical protein
MISHLVHPAIAQLLRFQTGARLRRILRGFSTPRRFVLSSLGLLLGAIWLGNAALTMVMREAVDPARFRSLVPLALMVYGLWHLVKVACWRPTQPVELSRAEQELLCGAPFRRRDVVAYRMATTVTAASVKALCFSLLMMPDLHVWAAGLVGALLALLFLDLLRMALEIMAWGVSERSYFFLRALVVSSVGAAVFSALITANCLTATDGSSGSALTFLTQLAQAAAELRYTWIGVILESPFQGLSRVITAEAWGLELAGGLVLSLAMVGAMAWLVVWLDAHFLRATTCRERRDYQRLEQLDRGDATPDWVGIELPAIAWRGGAGPLAWRQAIGAHRHATGLVLALSVPGVLACLPWLMHQDVQAAQLEVVGALAFYSFVLLPAALKFDFRRDYDRLALLKALPIRPMAMAFGQIATPVLLATGFQLTVLLTSLLIRPFHPGLVLVALLLLTPLNIFVFALDNLVFLLYPYRLTQEGLEIFVRATLTFTAKGLLFALALAAAMGWALAAGWISQRGAAWAGLPNRADVVFLAGACSVLVLCAVVTTYLLAWAFQRFDASQDSPA